MHLLILTSVLLHLSKLARCACESYGIDFTNGGSYFIDSTEDLDFTFLTQFEGCDDEEITPILVDPNEDEYFCSEIATSLDDTSFLSTCPILQTDMFSGTWYIVIEGLTFAYVRTFTLTAGTPVTVTATPTVTIGVTSTPDAISKPFPFISFSSPNPTLILSLTILLASTYTSTSTLTTTLTPSTLTTPCKTLSSTTTLTPFPKITTTTKTITITRTTATISTSTTSTIISTAICTPPPYPPGMDPKLQKPLYLPHTTIIPRSPKVKKERHVRDFVYKGVKGMRSLVGRNVGMAKRGPDEATVTVTETTSSATVVTTSTVSAATVVLTAYTTTLLTQTPSPITHCSGVTKVTKTVTAPTMTITRLSVTQTTVFATKTIKIGHTIHSTTTPKAVSTSCINKGGHI